MHPIRSAASAAILALSLAACSSLPADSRSTHSSQGVATGAASQHAAVRQTAAATTPSVLLVSLDGFRADYLDLGITPNLARIVDAGVRADWMTPSFPSLTFPNHYTIVTGLRPDGHGLVHNTMFDAELGDFRLNKREAVNDGRWWGGEPIWVGAENQGLATATLFWPGSEAEVAGVRPTRWKPFDKDMTMDARVDTVLGWLTEAAATRPRLATLYFEQIDSAAHAHGPDSAEAIAMIREVDAQLGRLLDGLAARGLDDAVNLIVVSDHGMATVPDGQVVVVEDMVDPAHAKLITAGQTVGFAPLAGHETAAEAQLLGRHGRYECWRKDGLPARLHYGTHPRVPAIVCQMDEGWDALPREWAARRPAGDRGSHGFDPALPSMRAIFIARGPAFREGDRIPAIENVDVYPLLARLLGITPAAHDGDANALVPALRNQSPQAALAH